MQPRFRLPYGTGTLPVRPGPFDLREVPAPPTRPAGEAGDVLEQALDRPLGTPRLEALVRPGDAVLLVVSDATRATAAGRVAGALLARLRAAGIDDSDVSCVVACGLHPPPDEAGYEAILGSTVAGRLRRIPADAAREADFVDLGVTRRGTPIRLHRALVESRHVVLTGALGFHYYAGFTGGRKSVLPGLAAPASIAANHLLALRPDGGRDPAARAGRLEGNPVHLDMSEACARVEPSFLVNVLCGADGVEMAVAGHWDRAHRQGCEDLRRRRAAPVDGPADLALVSAGGHPHDIDLIQTHKAIEAAFPLVRPGGAMVVLGACARGPGHPRLEAWLDGRDAAALAAALREAYEVYGQTALALRAKAEALPIWLVSDLPAELVRRAGLRPAPDPQVALAEAAAFLGGGGRGWVLERGAALLPRLPESGP